MPNLPTLTLFALIAADVPLQRVASTHGGKYAGPCPFCGRTDRFRVWPHAGPAGRYKCLGYTEGRNGCGRGGADAIQYLRHRESLSYREACERLGIDRKREQWARPERKKGVQLAPVAQGAPLDAERLEPPNRQWQAAGWTFMQESIDHLHAPVGRKALAWLQRRGIDLATIHHAHLGYNPSDRYQDRMRWGLLPALNQQGQPQALWLPRGIVIPWLIGDQLWHINIRRPVGIPKYVGPGGWKTALY